MSFVETGSPSLTTKAAWLALLLVFVSQSMSKHPATFISPYWHYFGCMRKDVEGALPLHSSSNLKQWQEQNNWRKMYYMHYTLHFRMRHIFGVWSLLSVRHIPKILWCPTPWGKSFSTLITSRRAADSITELESVAVHQFNSHRWKHN